MIAAAPGIDAVLAVTSARNPAGWMRERETLMRVGQEIQKPILLWAYTLPHPDVRDLVSRAGLAMFENPRNCAATAAALADYRAFRAAYLKPAVVRDPVADTVRTAARAVLASAGPVLPEFEARQALVAYGIGAAATALAATAEEAVVAAALTEKPVVLKVQSPDIPHKTEAGAVAVNVQGGPAVADAFERIVAAARAFAPDAKISGVLVQPVAADGLEVIAGVHRDPQFGPMVMLGLGGVLVEVLDDVVFAPLPLRQDQALAMIRRLKGAALFDGVRGGPKADSAALADVLHRLVADYELASKLAEQGRDWVLANRTWERSVAKVLPVLPMATGWSPGAGAQRGAA